MSDIFEHQRQQREKILSLYSTKTVEKSENNDLEKGGPGSGRRSHTVQEEDDDDDDMEAAAERAAKYDEDDYPNKFKKRGDDHESVMRNNREYKKLLKKGGEGSRGGRVIGHTKSGKPIYEKYEQEHTQHYTSEDHSDAMHAHMNESKKYTDKFKEYSDRAKESWGEGATALSANKAADSKTKQLHHSSMAQLHRDAFESKIKKSDGNEFYENSNYNLEKARIQSNINDLYKAQTPGGPPPGKEHLTPKVITDKNGHRKTVYVNKKEQHRVDNSRENYSSFSEDSLKREFEDKTGKDSEEFIREEMIKELTSGSSLKESSGKVGHTITAKDGTKGTIIHSDEEGHIVEYNQDGQESHAHLTHQEFEDGKKNGVFTHEDMRLIYRDNNGFEAFVVGETSDTWKIEGNGVKCSVWKSTTKSKIRKVPSDYILR